MFETGLLVERASVSECGVAPRFPEHRRTPRRYRASFGARREQSPFAIWN